MKFILFDEEGSLAYGKTIVTLASLETLLIIVVELFCIIKSSTYDDLLKYAVLALISNVALIFFAFHGIIKENIFEVFAFAACSFMLVLITIFQILTVDDQGLDSAYMIALIVQLAVTVILPPIYGYLIYKVYFEISFRILFKFQDNETLRHSYYYYQVFLTVLKFDTQLNATLLAILILFIFGNGYAAYVLIPAFVIITFGGSIMSYYGALHEKRIVMILFGLILIAQPAYLLYKEIKLSAFGSDPDEQDMAAKPMKLAFYWIAGTIGLLIRACLMFVVYKVTRNFDKGLKAKLLMKEDVELESKRATQPSRHFEGVL